MPEYLTQDEVDALKDGTEIVVRWADRTTKPRAHTVVIRNGMPHVQEVKPSGFSVWVPLHPVADAKNRMRMRISLPYDEHY